MSTRIITSHECEALTEWHGLIAALDVAHRALATGGAVQPVPQSLRIPGDTSADGPAAVDAEEAAEASVEDHAALTVSPRRRHARRTNDLGVVVQGHNDMWVKLAKCCTPVPGDEILGFVTRGGGVSVHRKSCTNAGDLNAEPARIGEVEWAPSTDSVFLVAIQVEALDRHRLLSDVTRALADERVNILSASVQTSRDRVAVSRFTFELADPAHLGSVLQTVRNVDGVFDVERVTA